MTMAVRIFTLLPYGKWDLLISATDVEDTLG
jgi:hypothetical protein